MSDFEKLKALLGKEVVAENHLAGTIEDTRISLLGAVYFLERKLKSLEVSKKPTRRSAKLSTELQILNGLIIQATQLEILYNIRASIGRVAAEAEREFDIPSGFITPKREVHIKQPDLSKFLYQIVLAERRGTYKREQAERRRGKTA